MKRVIQWAVRNGPAMNTLMVAGIVIGAIGMLSLRREVFPEFDLEIVLISVPYPGASPDEIEEGVCQKIEEAVRSIDGVKKQTSVAQEGAGHVVLELEADIDDAQRVLNEVRSAVDRIPSFPELAEDPEIEQITLREPVIRVGLIGPDKQDSAAALRLRSLAEEIRGELLQLPAVSQAELVGAPLYQIDVEIPEETLREYGLTLKGVADIIRRQNLEMPGGEMKTEGQEVLLRGKNKKHIGEDIADIPLVTHTGGVVLTVGDLGTVRDEFADTTNIIRVNGQPGAVISVERTTKEDLLAMVDSVHEYVKTKEVPAGYQLMTWADRSVEVRERLDMLTSNAFQGLALVILMLALFLDLRLAFWVAMAIPLSVLGGCAVLYFTGHTINMLTSFAFLMVLGIEVDDAIVIGENVYSHRLRGKSLMDAAIDGTAEVFPSVLCSVLTTVIAFLPMMYVAGVMGKFIAVMPVTVIAVLLISLTEATLILPVHLAHNDGPLIRTINWLLSPFHFVVVVLTYVREHCQQGLDWLNDHFYTPIIRSTLNRPSVALSFAFAILLVCFGAIRAGITPFVIFPKVDSNSLQARVVYPDGTPASVADASTLRMEEAILSMDKEVREQGGSLVRVAHRTVGQVSGSGALGPDTRTTGSNAGGIFVELVDGQSRDMDSQQIVAEWRRRAGEFPGAERVTFGTEEFGPGGTPIEFKLLAPAEYTAELEAAVERTKAKLAEYPGVFDIADDSRPGKWEFQLTVKDQAHAMGVPLAELASTVRSSYYGEEVMRLQRGRHEVKLMVRYPPNERRSLANFEEIRVRGTDGAERPLTEVANVRVDRGYAEINRVDQMRSISIMADIDEATGNAFQVVGDLQASFMPQLFAEYPHLRVRWEGQQEQTLESINSLFVGLIVALAAMYLLLTMEFRSYAQPLIVMAAIPFGAVGAVFGHWIQGMPLTLFSVFGLVALTGVVVNDSIVFVDFINARIADGLPIRKALLRAGRQRIRPVFLTSVTTIVGLLPIIFEPSYQAQIVIPMATSLGFGLIFSTGVVLVLVPSMYMVYYRICERLGIAEDAEHAAEHVHTEAARSHSESLAPPPHGFAHPQIITAGSNGNGSGNGNGNGHTATTHSHETDAV